MIITDPNEQFWEIEFEAVEPAQVTLFVPSSERVSEILGPDGEPLKVGFEHPMVGFDLRGRKDG